MLEPSLSAPLSLTARARLWIQRPDVIGAAIGFSAIVRGFFPPETWTTKLWLTAMLFLLTLALLLAGQSRERSDRASKSILSAEIKVDRFRTEQALRELWKSQKRDVRYLHAARQNAAYVAKQIRDFLAQCPRPAVPTNITDENLYSPEVLQYCAVIRNYDLLLAHEYQDRFMSQALSVANDLAHSGEPDEVLVALIYNVHFAGMLMHLADRLEKLSKPA